MLKSEPDYRAYLLRLWQAGHPENLASRPTREEWRASLEDPHTGERLGFGSLAALFDFLEQQTGPAAEPVLRTTPDQRRERRHDLDRPDLGTVPDR